MRLFKNDIVLPCLVFVLQQNLGAMLRSAYCLGVSGVLACSRNCAPLSPVVSKASAGAMELMTLHSCR
jgi:21S rRNA (GM2251-2'-O)-methyltransferase